MFFQMHMCVCLIFVTLLVDSVKLSVFQVVLLHPYERAIWCDRIDCVTL